MGHSTVDAPRSPSQRPARTAERGDGRGDGGCDGTKRMIRVAHVIMSADARAGGTTTALFNILAAAEMVGKELELAVYFRRPPEGDPAWATIERNPSRFHLGEIEARHLVAGD